MKPLEGDVAAMRSALTHARAALATDDVPIGAVVLSPSGSVLAGACNAREATGDPTAHAEILALRAAAVACGDGWRLTGCTLVVTVEPCTMCAGALVLSRVARLVFGAWEPRTGAVGSVWDVVRDRRSLHRPEVVAGVLASESSALLDEFFKTRRLSGAVGGHPSDMSIFDKAKDKAEQMVGGAKEKLGQATDNEDMENAGKRDQTTGELKETGHDLRDKAAGTYQDVKRDVTDER